MAAGLPRDLIRSCRALFDLHEEQEQANTGGNQLATLSNYSMRLHLKAKLLAVSVAANFGTGKPDLNRFFELVHELEQLLDSTNDLIDKRSNLLKIHNDFRIYNVTLTQAIQGSSNEGEVEEVVKRYEEVAWLSAELAAYLYYSVALLELFGQKNFDRAKFMRAEQTGTLDRLVKARQFAAVSPSMATSEIAELRNLNST
jgi:hypothetical protein